MFKTLPVVDAQLDALVDALASMLNAAPMSVSSADLEVASEPTFEAGTSVNADHPTGELLMTH